MKPCCEDLANRGPEERLGPELTFRRCKCGLRHFEVTLDPAVFAVATKGI